MFNLREQFTTNDFYTACFLKATGFKFIGINKQEKRHTFIFEDERRREKLLKDFFSGDTMIEPRSFINAIKEIKSLIYNSSIE